MTAPEVVIFAFRPESPSGGRRPSRDWYVIDRLVYVDRRRQSETPTGERLRGYAAAEARVLALNLEVAANRHVSTNAKDEAIA